MSNDPHTFTGDSARRIAKAVRTVEANDPLYTGPKRRRRYKYVRQSFLAQITDSESIGTNRWKYAWSEVRRTTLGFETVSGGRSGTLTSGYAINAIEANNDDTGTQGNSVDIDGAIFTANTGLAIQPAEGDPVVTMWMDYLADGTPSYTFEYVNAIDGECAA